MTKQLRGILALAVAAIVLGGAYLLINNRQGAADTGVLAVLKQGESISTVTIENQYGRFSFAQIDDKWNVETNGRRYRANDEKMELMLSALNSLPITRILDEELPEYGLSQPIATVTFATSKGRAYSFTVGNETVSAGGAYIKDKTGGQTMVTTTAAVAQLTGSLAAYRSKQVLTIDSDILYSIAYYKNGQKVVEVANNGPKNWFMSYPYDAPARSIELNELTSKMRKWSVAGYPNETDFAKMGLDNNANRLELTDANGNTQSLVIGDSDGGTGTYVRIGEGDEIVKLYTVDLDFDVLHPNKLIFVAPLKTTVDKLSAIHIKTPEEAIEFTVEQLADGQRITSGNKEISMEDFSSMFFQYIAMNAQGRDPAQASEEAVAVLTTTFTDGTTAKLTLVPRDTETYYMLLDGKTEYYLSVADLEQLLYRAHKALDGVKTV